MEQYYLALDIGGTKTSGALFFSTGCIVDDYVHVARSKTYDGQQAVFDNSCQVISHILDHFSISTKQLLGIGIGAPGPLDTKRQVILHAPMMGWYDFPIGKKIRDTFLVPTALDNDGNLGALAEQRCGLAKGCSNVAYITVSTGIGGGIVINGQPYRGKNDGAGEFGHLCIEPDGRKCNCGAKGCVELYASGTALTRKMKQDMDRGIQSVIFDNAKYRQGELNARLLCNAAKSGDSYALSLFKQEGKWLGRLTAAIFNFIDPDMLIIGGGVAKSNEFFHDELMETAREWSINSIADNQVQYSLMNDRLILYGAFYLISEAI